MSDPTDMEPQSPGQDVTVPEESVQRFRLLDLPPEIRLEIYGYLLSPPELVDAKESYPVEREDYRYPRTEKPTMNVALLLVNRQQEAVPRTEKPTMNVALLRVNRQIYQEAVPLLYHVPTFKFSSMTDLEEWLHIRQPEKSWMTITNVKVPVPFEIPDAGEYYPMFFDWSVILTQLGLGCPGLQKLTLEWVHTEPTNSDIRKNIADIVLASGIRNLRQLTLENLEPADEKEMMEQLAPMLRGYQEVATAAK